MSHSHEHHNTIKNIKLAFFLNLGFSAFELIGGIMVNSVAIVSDSLHDFGDSLSLGLSWYLEKKSKKNPDKNFTFGYQRFSLLSALINSIVLIIGSVFVIQEAIDRLLDPESSNGLGMLLISIIGIVVNGYVVLKMRRGKTMNERVLSWHLMEDVLGWIAVFIISIILLFKDIPYLDPGLSLGITTFILWNVAIRLRETLLLFLQAVPIDIDVEELIKKLLSIDEIISTHNAYLWSLDGKHHVFSAHVVVKRVEFTSEIEMIKIKIRNELKSYGLKNITLEIEFDTAEMH